MTQKSLRIEPAPGSALVRIAWTNGGEVPGELQGNWTTPLSAKMAIQKWMAAHPEREQTIAEVEVIATDDHLKKRPSDKYAKREVQPI